MTSSRRQYGAGCKFRNDRRAPRAIAQLVPIIGGARRGSRLSRPRPRHARRPFDALDGAGGIIDEVPFVLAMSGALAPAHNGELYPHLRALAPAALTDERGRIMRRHVFEKVFCVFRALRIAGHREIQVIDGSRNASELSPMSRASPCAKSPRHCPLSGTSWCRSPART
jgi:hypothetical protein